MHARFLLPLLGVAAVTIGATRAPEASWGKAGVSYDQYREDTVACAREGLRTDIAGTEPVQSLVKSSTQLENELTRANPDYGNASRIREAARADLRFKEVKKIMEDQVAACLIRAGYSRFRMTEDQRAKLRKLKPGSTERRQYVHALASDAAVLKAQAI